MNNELLKIAFEYIKYIRLKLGNNVILTIMHNKLVFTSEDIKFGIRNNEECYYISDVGFKHPTHKVITKGDTYDFICI